MKLAFLLATTLISSIFTCKSHSQIKEINNLNFSDEIKYNYPFITDRIIEITTPEINGSLGYSIVILDKTKLIEYLSRQSFLFTESALKKSNFYQDDCYFNPTCNGITVLKLQQQELREINKTVQISKNNESLKFYLEHELIGKFKAWKKESYVGFDFWNTKICEDGETTISPSVKLLYLLNNISINFETNNKDNYYLLLNINSFLQTLISTCNKPSSPYTSIYHRNLNNTESIKINLTKTNELGNFFEYTSSIKVTQDDNFYYIYFIKML
jgi:hypothetical protein